MTLAAEKLGAEAFEEATGNERQLHFWYSEGTRPYMYARAELAYLLWRKQGRLQEAIAYFGAGRLANVLALASAAIRSGNPARRG